MEDIPDYPQNKIKKSISIKITDTVFLLLIWLCVLFIIFTRILDSDSTQKFISKNAILPPMSKVIKNGGSIDEVKHIFNSKTLVNEPFFGANREFKESHYQGDVALSYILSDLLVEYYQKDQFKEDSLYVTRLYNIIEEYNTIHPYDGLEENQRYYLENIRQKLDSNYRLIQEDIIQLGDELDRKNLLVNKYLAKSETSYVISIIALALTIILSLWQIRQNYKSGKRIDTIISSLTNDQSKEQK